MRGFEICVKIRIEMKILHKDSIKYLPYKYKNEEELERMVCEHSEILFGEGSVFFSKQKIKTISGIGTIPDGFLILLKEKKWYIVEVELSSHPLYDHVVAQVIKFNGAIKNPNNRKKLAGAFYKEVESKENFQLRYKIESGGIRELYKFLSDIVDETPEIIIVIDERTVELEEVCENLPFKTNILEFQTYFRESVGIGVHIHLFDVLRDGRVVKEVLMPEKKRESEELVKPKRKKLGEITPQREYRIPILESLIEMGGSGRVKGILERVQRKMAKRLTLMDWEQLPSGNYIRWRNAVMWERLKMTKEGLLKSNSPTGIWEITKEGEKGYHSQKA